MIAFIFAVILTFYTHTHTYTVRLYRRRSLAYVTCVARPTRPKRYDTSARLYVACSTDPALLCASLFFGNYVQKFSESRARCARRFMPIIMPIHWSIYHEFFCSAATVLFLLSVCFYTPQLHVIKQTTCQQTSFEYFFLSKTPQKTKN